MQHDVHAPGREAGRASVVVGAVIDFFASSQGGEMLRVSGSLKKLLGVVAAGTLLLGSGAAMAQIATTKHNLGTTGAAGQNRSGGTEEICVFCHTPHGADTSAQAPLWNKNLQTLGTGANAYQVYSSSTMDAARASDGNGGGSIGSVSLACLSCHDGTQAMDNVINAPGSGGYDVTGGGAPGRQGAGPAGDWGWTGPNVTADGLMANPTTNVALIGTDLRNDHPIGIQYCGGGITGTGTAGCKDADFWGGGTNTGRLRNATINAQNVWWVDTEATTGNNARNKTDMILYTRAFSDGTTGPSVECASCHDPHTAAAPTFLRVSNTGSQVCLSCHVK